LRLALLIFPALASGLVVIPAASVAQVQGPLQVAIAGETVANEGDRVSYSIFPWTGGAAVVASSYRWDFGDGSDPVEREQETAVGHRFMKDGEYTVSASDGAGVTTLQVVVQPLPPVLEMLSHDGPHFLGETTTFQAVARDPGADTLTYTWDFGDGSPPRTGRDLYEVTRAYSRPGNYQVTLTVTDEDGLEARRTVRVAANPGFFGQLSGDVNLPVEGVSGRASLTNALPGSRAIPLGGMPLFTGSAPMGVGVADLSEDYGMCFVVAGFWDDENKVHVNFFWTVAADSVWIPEAYPANWRAAEEGVQSGQMMVNALVLAIEPSYEDTKRGAETMQVFEPGVGSLLTNVGGLLSALMGGKPPPANPGRNWQLTSPSGVVNITRVTPRFIAGNMAVGLMGAWMSVKPGGSGTAESQMLQGSFMWELDDVARINLLRCGDRPFAVASHRPEVEARAVDYEKPGVSVTFSLPVSRKSVSAETLELGYLGSSGGFNRIDARIVFDPDPRKVRLVPKKPLDDAVYHMVRVRGGEQGIKSIGDDPLPDGYEWRFSTLPELVARPEGSSP